MDPAVCAALRAVATPARAEKANDRRLHFAGATAPAFDAASIRSVNAASRELVARLHLSTAQARLNIGCPFVRHDLNPLSLCPIDRILTTRIVTLSHPPRASAFRIKVRHMRLGDCSIPSISAISASASSLVKPSLQRIKTSSGVRSARPKATRTLSLPDPPPISWTPKIA